MLNSSKKYYLLLILIITNLLLVSCGNDKLIKCQKITTLALTLDQEVKENLKNNDPNSVKKVITIFEQKSKELKNIPIRDEKLNQYNQQLSQIYQQYGENTHQFLKNFEAKNVEKTLFYQQEINTLFQQQKQLVTEINNYCNP